jgi:hypothetical protein
VTEPIEVFMRVGADNDEIKIGQFRPVSVPDARGAVTIVDNDRPLAELLRLVADVIEVDGNLPVAPA